jgi:hypothetical protein
MVSRPLYLSDAVCQSVDRLPTLEGQERQYVLLALEKTGGNCTQAVQILGIDRVSLRRKLKRHGLDDWDPRAHLSTTEGHPTRPHVQHSATHSRHAARR